MSIANAGLGYCEGTTAARLDALRFTDYPSTVVEADWALTDQSVLNSSSVKTATYDM
jgi:hypothetical protein